MRCVVLLCSIVIADITCHLPVISLLIFLLCVCVHLSVETRVILKTNTEEFLLDRQGS